MKKKLLCGLLSLAMISTSYSVAFADSGDSFSVGCRMKSVGTYTGPTDTTQEATYANKIFKKNGYYGILKTTPEQTDFTSKNLNSSMLFLAGHGSGTDLTFPYYNSNKEVGISTSHLPIKNFTSIENQSFDNTIIGILAACHSGERGGIADYIRKNGAICTLGWQGKVNDTGMEDYCYLLLDYLDDGNPMMESMISTVAGLANGDGPSGLIWDDKGENEEDKNVINTLVYGNYNYGINGRTRNSITESIKEDFQFSAIDTKAKVYRNIDKVNYDIGSKDYSEINEYIKNNIDSEFNTDKFEVSEREMFKDSGCYIVTCTYYIEDFKTNFAYNIFIIGNKVVEISKVGNEVYDIDIDVPDENLITIPTPLDNVKSTSFRKRYDTENKKFYYDIFTTYQSDLGAEFCTMETFEF